MQVWDEQFSPEWNVLAPPIKWTVMIQTKHKAVYHVGMNRCSSSTFAAAFGAAGAHLQAQAIASANIDFANLTSLQEDELTA
jgi:hypothetical protein